MCFFCILNFLKLHLVYELLFLFGIWVDSLLYFSDVL